MAGETQVSDAYTYGPLDEPSKSIRLINIMSSTPHITCRFKVVSLDDSPAFSALSYMWGNAAITEDITVDGGILAVTINLANAIRDVHHQWGKGRYSTSGEDQWLWADAICINQTDVQEKNEQVPLMKIIYPEAQRMLSWLGREEQARRGIYALNLVSDAISQLPSYECIQEATKYGTFTNIENIDNNIKEKHSQDVNELQWLKNHYDVAPGSESAASLFGAISELINLPYWSRVWIFQEVVLARDLIMLCGTATTSWRIVCSVLLWKTLFRLNYGIMDLPRGMPALELGLLTQFSAHHPFANIKFTRYQRTNRQLDKRIKYSLSILAHDLVATDPKDYVYGLGGIIGHDVPADYGAEKTVAQVYHDFVASWFATCAEFPEERVGKEPTHLFFLDAAGIGSIWDRVPELCSWALNYEGVAAHGSEPSAPNYQKKFFVGCERQGRKEGEGFCIERAMESDYIHNQMSAMLTFFYIAGNGDNGVFTQDTTKPRLENLVLCCTTVIIDHLIKVGPIVQTSREAQRHQVELGQWLLWIFDQHVRLNPLSSTNLPLLYKMLVLIAGERPEVDLPRLLDLFLDFLVNEMEDQCHKTLGVDRATVYRSLCIDPLPTGELDAQHVPLDLGWISGVIDDRSMHVDWGYRMGVRARYWISRDPLKRPEILDDTFHYAAAMTQLNMHRFGCTTSDLLGIFPPFTEVGDLVCVLNGYTLPVVLRKHGDGYKFVGNCKVHGLMDGEAGDLLRDGRATVEEVKIY